MTRRNRLAAARLYLVTSLRPGGRELDGVLRAALRGGVDIVQLRDKEADDDALLEAATVALGACAEADALLVINDRPDLAIAAGADGVHVGQDDMPVEAVRELVGPEMLVGLSTHTPADIDRVHGQPVDYIGVGPIHATPTKPGRPAVGVELVHHAVEAAPVPWFAIGGVDSATLGAVTQAGATRIAVVRAITESADPEAAARTLRAAAIRPPS